MVDETTPAGRRRSNWTEAYWRWARSIEFGEDRRRGRLRALHGRRGALRRGQEGSSSARWRRPPRFERAPVVDALCLAKGIDVASAFLLAAEAGDFSRFPERAVVRLVVRPGSPQGRSSGETESRGGITRRQRPRPARACRGVLASRMSTRHP